MVATRRGTRAEPEDETERSAAEQTPEKVILPTSPIQTRSSAKKDGQTGENSTDESKSAVISRSPIKSDPVINSTQIITRSRHRSGQSDADISEAESTASNTSTRRSRSRQSLGQLTDSNRKLRSHRSALITEPIIESKEDVELSDAESNCSSVSTTARGKPPGTIPCSVSTRSRKSLLLSKPTSDVSDAESNYSPVSGVRSIATRSTGNTNTRCLSSLPSEPQKEQTSDAESCSSGFSMQPLARRSSSRIKSHLQADEVVSLSHTDDASDHETLKKQSPKIHSLKSDAPPSVGQQNVLLSPRRSLRNQPAVKKDVVDSDDEPESSDAVNKDLDLKEAKVEESSMTKEVDLPVEGSVVLSLQSCETRPEENVIADQVLRPLEDPLDEESAMEKSVVANDNDANEDLPDAQENTNMAESTNIRLLIDDGKKSEHSDKEDETNMEVEKEENEQVVDKGKSKKVSQQLQDVSEDGLFVLDTAPGVDSSKMLFLKPDDDDETDADEKGKPPRPDDDEDEHENNMEILEEDDNCNEQVEDKEKSKKVSTLEIQDVSGDGLLVKDTAHGVDSENDVDEKGQPPRPDEEQDGNIMEREEDDDDHKQVVDKGKSKKASKQHLQDLSEDGLFVIDTTSEVDSSKKFLLELEDDEDEKGDPTTPDEENYDDEEDENNMEMEEEDDNEQVVDKGKSKKASKQQLQGISGEGLFVIDTAPGVDSSKKYYLESEDKDSENEADERRETPMSEDDDEDFIDEDEEEDEEETLLNRPKSGFMLSTSIDPGISLKKMGGLYINFDAAKPNPGPSLLAKMKKGNKKKDELLQKSVISPDFEKKESVPPYTESQHKLKKLRKEERDKSSGRGWFDMKAPQLTDELKNDLKALKMRSAMDPKHFYKKNDREGFPKYFQVGTVVDDPIDFYHSRIPKKERKRTIVEELLADSEFRRYNKKKFKEIIAEKAARSEGKKNRKKKKFQT